jgi:signal peptidase I
VTVDVPASGESEQLGPAETDIDVGATVEDDDDGTSDPQPTRWGRWVLEWLAVLVVALVVAVTVRAFLVQTYFIPSPSMEPTLMVGDRIAVDKISYHLHDVHRGDIVVFGRPPLETATADKDLVKRVIGLPGETISSDQEGNVLINGKILAQPWLTAAARTDPGPPIRSQVIPVGDYFVMGDNRGDSSDSRVFGPIPSSLIVGHAVVRIWPPSRLGGL